MYEKIYISLLHFPCIYRKYLGAPKASKIAAATLLPLEKSLNLKLISGASSNTVGFCYPLGFLLVCWVAKNLGCFLRTQEVLQQSSQELISLQPIKLQYIFVCSSCTFSSLQVYYSLIIVYIVFSKTLPMKQLYTTIKLQYIQSELLYTMSKLLYTAAFSTAAKSALTTPIYSYTRYLVGIKY